MDPDSQLRNLRDFLLVYNRMTEICFQRCSSNFNYRSLTMDESRCVDSCAGKLIRSNHRLMATYSQLMPRMVQRRMEEMESRAAAAEQQQVAEQAALAAPPVAEASETTVAMATPTPPPATDFGPEAADAVSLPTGFDAPVELQAATAVSTATDGSPPSTGGPPLPP